MNLKLWLPILGLGVALSLTLFGPSQAPGGEVSSNAYKVLDPIRHGNLTVFPVVAAKSYDTQEFLTLDEGVHSGEVVVTEAGSARRWSPQALQPRSQLAPGAGCAGQPTGADQQIQTPPDSTGG